MSNASLKSYLAWLFGSYALVVALALVALTMLRGCR